MAFPNDYIQYQEVTIDCTKVEAVLTDFPILIDLSDLNLTTSIFDTCRSDGGDIRVTLSDGVTQLAREIVAIDTTAKTGKMRVCIPELPDTGNLTIKVWCNGVDTEPAADSTYGAQAVWDSNFAGVWHLNNDGKDSTANGYDGTLNGTYTFSPGRVCGNALDCNGAWITTPCPKVSIGTVEMQINFDAFTTYRLLYSVTSHNDDFEAWTYSTGELRLRNRYTTCGYLSTNTWYHFAYRYDQIADTSYGNGSVHLNGANVTGNPYSSGKFGSGTILFGANDAGGGYPFPGLLESIRYSNIMRSVEWLETMYNNESSPSTFYSVSAAEQTSSTETQQPIVFIST